jgi:ABC-2 type transport system ATP-binding protein
LRELISELSRMGRTVVISSHILSELEGICSHLAIVDLGRVLAMGSVDEIRSKLFGQRRVIARVAEMHVERTEALLRTKEDLSDLDVERGQVSFSFSGGDEISAALLSEVVGAGVPVVEWRVQSAGLEELFMQLTNVPVAGAARPDEAPVEEGDIE